MRFIDEKRKNLFRAYVAQAASVLEIVIAVLVLAAILITGVRAAGEVFGVFCRKLFTGLHYCAGARL